MTDWWIGYMYGAASVISMGTALYGLINTWLDHRDRQFRFTPRHRNRAGARTKRLR